MKKQNYTAEEFKFAKALGERLRKARKHRDMTLKALSEALEGVRSITQLSVYERGIVLADPYIISLIAKELQVNACWLFTGKKTKKQD